MISRTRTERWPRSTWLIRWVVSAAVFCAGTAQAQAVAPPPPPVCQQLKEKRALPKEGRPAQCSDAEVGALLKSTPEECKALQRFSRPTLARAIECLTDSAALLEQLEKEPVDDTRGVWRRRPLAPVPGSPASLPAAVTSLQGDVRAVVEQLYARFVAALQEQAQADVVDYILTSFSKAICPDGGETAAWLPATCAASDSGAWSGSVNTGGTAALQSLVRALEEDFRQIPGHLAAQFARSRLATNGIAVQRSAARAVEAAIDALVDGEPLATVLDRAAQALRQSGGQAVQPGPAADAACALQVGATVLRLYRAGALSAANLESVGPTAHSVDLIRALYSVQCDGGTAKSQPITWFLKTYREMREHEALITLTLADWTQEMDAHEARRSVLLSSLTSPDSRFSGTPAQWLELAALAELGLAEAETTLRSTRQLLAGVLGSQSPAPAGKVARLEGLLADLEDLIGELRPLLRATASRDYGRLWAAILRLEAKVDGFEPLPAPLRKHGPLIAALAGARSGEDIKAVLLAAAAPAGSYRIKARSDTTVLTLSGLWGASYNFHGQRPGGGQDWRFAAQLPFGLDLVLVRPVGIPLSIFVQWIDPVQAALTSGAAQLDAGEYFAAGLSPGLRLKAGLGQSPFAISAGAKGVPTVVHGKPIEFDWVLGASLDVDATLWILKGM